MKGRWSRIIIFTWINEGYDDEKELGFSSDTVRHFYLILNHEGPQFEYLL